MGHVSFESRKTGLRDTVVQSRWNSFEEEEALRVRDLLSYERVMDINPFEVGRRDLQARALFERRRRRIVALLRIEPFWDRTALSLSNGESQRVQLARALCHPLRLLILDEPFAGMDIGSRRHFHRVLEKLMASRLRVLVIATRPEDLPRRVTHVLRVGNCRILGAGPRAEMRGRITVSLSAGPDPATGAGLRGPKSAGGIRPLHVSPHVEAPFGRNADLRSAVSQACGLPAARSHERPDSFSAAGLGRTARRLEVCHTADRRSAPPPRATQVPPIPSKERRGLPLSSTPGAEPAPARTSPVNERTPGRGKGGARASGQRHSRPGPKDAPLFELRNVTVRYGEAVVLRDITWTVYAGENWALLGPNGSGKTTLLSLILGDHPQAYANDVRVFGKAREAGESIWDLKRKIGWVSPELHLHFEDSATCFDVVASGFRQTIGLFEPPTARQRAIARQWLARFHLLPFARTPLYGLSAGLQRMALLARALVNSPRLLILDEPCQGLDGPHRSLFLRAVDQLQRGGRVTVIYVTHRADELPRSIQQVLHLKNGLAVAELYDRRPNRQPNKRRV